MKILICTGIYPPDIGGPATYAKLVAEGLLEHGHNTQVLSFGDVEIPNPKSQINSKLKIFYVSRKYPAGIRHLAYLWQVLKLGKTADIIYVQDPVSVGLPATLANLLLRKKMVLKIVGDYAWEQEQQLTAYGLQLMALDNFYPFNKKHPFKIKLLQKIQSWVAERAGKIIVPSFYLKNILTKGWDVPAEKIKVIYNSFDVPAAIAGSETARPPQPFKLLSVGRLVPWKGFDTLIDIVKGASNVELEIVGDGPEYKNYELRITDYGLQNRVKLSGQLSHGEVGQKMYSSDLFVLNSGYEGLSHVILEAMACGLPIAVSRAGGNIELIGENKERGYLFDYNNKEQIKEKVNYIISHPEEAQEKAKKAREFVADFSKEKMIAKLEAEINF